MVMKKSHVIPASLNKRLISTLMSNRKVDPNESKTFALKSSSEFASRSGDVFGKLQSLEDSHKTWVSKNDTIEYFEESEEPTVPKLQPRSFEKIVTKDEYIQKAKSTALELKIEVPSTSTASKIPCDSHEFKKPFPVKKWQRKAGGTFEGPKFRPKKWKKYSLEDVQVSSEASNAAIAFEFLDSLRSNKKKNEEVEISDEKIMFKKPKRKEKNFAGNDIKQVPVAADTSESSKEKKRVLGELKPPSGNIILAHLQDE